MTRVQTVFQGLQSRNKWFFLQDRHTLFILHLPPQAQIEQQQEGSPWIIRGKAKITIIQPGVRPLIAGDQLADAVVHQAHRHPFKRHRHYLSLDHTRLSAKVVPIQIAHHGLQTLIPENNLILGCLEEMFARQGDDIRGNGWCSRMRCAQRVQKPSTTRDCFYPNLNLDCVEVGKFVQAVFEDGCCCRLPIGVQLRREPEDQLFGRRRWRGRLFFDHLSGFCSDASRQWNRGLPRSGA